MSKTVSARISKETHKELLQRCNKAGCTVNEWINAAIDYLFTGSSEFDFGEDESEESNNESSFVSKTQENMHENKPIPGG